MTEFYDLISKINKDHLLNVKCFYSWRKGWNVRVYTEGRDIPVIHVLGDDRDEVFNEVIELLLQRYF